MPSLDRALIEEQLKRVLESAHFAETTRIKRFLGYVVSETLEGRSDQIKGYTLGIDVFDKPADFDPSADTIVRVQANKLRARLDLYYANEGRGDPVRIHMPKGHYTPVFEIAVDPGSGADGLDGKPGDPRLSLAVMPFENLSGDPAQDPLAIAFTEEIITAIARFRELRVLSRHVTAQYCDRARDPRKLGADLGVRYLVDGTFRQLDDKIRVSAQLVCARTGDQVLSEIFDRDLSAESMFDIQDDVAARTAAKIAEPHGYIHRAGARHRAETKALDAYQARLLATEYWRVPSQAAHRRVRGLLEKAVSIDPGYAGAWGMLSILYGDEYRFNFNPRSDSPSVERALQAAETSVDLDHLNATGLHALFLAHFHLGNVDAFEAAARQALSVNPNYPDMLADLSVCWSLTGDLSAARAANTRAIELCPNPPGWFHGATFLMEFIDGRYEQALTATRKIGNALWSGPELYEAICLSMLGRRDEAEQRLTAFVLNRADPGALLPHIFEVWKVPEPLRRRLLDAVDTIPSGHLVVRAR